MNLEDLICELTGLINISWERMTMRLVALKIRDFYHYAINARENEILCDTQDVCSSFDRRTPY